MIVIGITGSIGMGKTTSANMLLNMGIPVHDADETVHKLMEPKGKAVKIVSERFEGCLDQTTGGINRKKLAEIIFNDDNKKKQLEEILHPLVRESQQDFMKLARQKNKSQIIVLDVPLLFETGSYRFCDYTICVTAPYFLQKQRVLARPGMSAEKFYRRLKGQMPDNEKRKMADFIVNTGLSEANTLNQLKNIVRTVLDLKQKQTNFITG